MERAPERRAFGVHVTSRWALFVHAPRCGGGRCRGQGSQSRARSWAQLLCSYQDAWSKAHPLLSLLALPGGALGTLRGGGVLGVLRPAAAPEALPYADAAHAAALLSASSGNPLALPPPPLVQLPGDVLRVQRAAQQLGALVGSWARDAAVALMAQVRGRDSGTCLPQLLGQLHWCSVDVIARWAGDGASLWRRARRR